MFLQFTIDTGVWMCCGNENAIKNNTGTCKCNQKIKQRSVLLKEKTLSSIQIVTN